MGFSDSHKPFVKVARKQTPFGSNLKTLAKIDPITSFLYDKWWHVEVNGLDRIPDEGPALIVGNTGGIIPWAGIMMAHALMSRKSFPRRLNIVCEMGWIEDERIYQFARDLGFVQWSADHVKTLFSQGELVAVFPEGVHGALKPFSERYRLRDFDWTRVLPAIEEKVPIIPLATIGCDESFPVIGNCEEMARMLNLPAFPVTPFMPFLPFPFNMISLPGDWKMRVLRQKDYKKTEDRNERYETAQSLAKDLEGEIQAELNRLLRMRIKASP